MGELTKSNGRLIMKMWIARDEDGRLYLHGMKPFSVRYGHNESGKACWDNEDENWMMLREESFPEVTFENSPIEVELVLKK